MKTLRKLLIDIGLLSILLFLGFQAGKFVAIPKGSILVSQSFLDSLAMVKDTVIIEVDTVPPVIDTFIVVREVPVPVPVNDSTYAYHDSLVNKQLSVHMYDIISNKGIIRARSWQWTLFVPETIINTIHEIKTVPVPYKVVEKQSYKYYGQVGYNVLGGITGEIGIVRNRYMLGVEAGKNTIQVNAGVLW